MKIIFFIFLAMVILCNVGCLLFAIIINNIQQQQEEDDYLSSYTPEELIAECEHQQF